MLPSDLSLPAKFTGYHPGQSEAIFSLYSSPTRYKLLSAPTGAGKSLLALSLAALEEARTLILVSTKALQQQYINDFSPMGAYSISGHSNYPCATRVWDDDGSLLDMECKAGASCSYRKAVEIANDRRTIVTNYAHWVHMSIVGDPLRLGYFDLIVCDEAHLVDSLLTDYLSVDFHRERVRSLLGVDLPPSSNLDLPTVIEWASKVLPIARETLSRVRSSASNGNGDPKDIARLVKLERSLNRVTTIGTAHWVTEKQPRGVKLSPVGCADYTEQYLFRGIPSALLCSATLHRSIIKHLGIPKSDSSYLEMASRFDPKRRPFIYIPTTRVDYRMTSGQVRQLVNRVDEIVDGRLDRKGIIHTRSYDRVKILLQGDGGSFRGSKFKSIMITHDSKSARDVIERFKRAEPPLILVSPSVEEGYDFPFDECRYQVILKVPFLDTRSPIMKARIALDKTYPDYYASLSLVQSVGRSTRDPNDYSETFILDDHWSWFRKRGMFEKWFKDSWVQLDRVPSPIHFD